MKQIILILLITISVFTYSQSNDSIKAKRVIITTSLYDYINPFILNSYIVNIGSEVYLKNKKSVFFNIGLIRPNKSQGSWFDVDAISSKGIKIQIEGKHFLNRPKIFNPKPPRCPQNFYKHKKNLNTGCYIALHSFYQFSKTERQETINDDTPFPNTHYFKNNYYVDRNVIGLNFLFGAQLIAKYGLTVDVAEGIGLQYISSKSINRLGDNEDKDYLIKAPLLHQTMFFNL